MKFSFAAKIYKVGINPCVKVPKTITDKMKPTRGFIPVKGKIENHSFTQTLVPIKSAPFRLYVNGPMLKGADVKVGQTVTFTIEQDPSPKSRKVAMHPQFRKALQAHHLMSEFKKLSPSRQKEILRYLNYLKTEETLKKNIEKVIRGLKKIEPSSLFRL